LAALVWNFRTKRGENQLSMKTAFILQAEIAEQNAVNKNKSWKVQKNEAYSPRSVLQSESSGYMVIGCGDSIDGNKYNWNWETGSTESWKNKFW